MKRMSENEYIIHLLEKLHERLDVIESDIAKNQRALEQHKTVAHTFRSLGKKHRQEALRDTVVPGRL
jgi:hypothetical protein